MAFKANKSTLLLLLSFAFSNQATALPSGFLGQAKTVKTPHVEQPKIIEKDSNSDSINLEEPPIVIEQLVEKADPLNNVADEAKNLRLNAIKNAAYNIGLQTGTNYYYDKINERLEQISLELNRIYNFKALMIDDNFIPPSVDEATNAKRFIDDKESVEAKSVLKFDHKSKIGLTPDWRDYLYKKWPKPKKINSQLIPKTEREKSVFNDNYSRGWSDGKQQAKALYKLQMAKLTNDYQNMARYHNLVEMGIVTKPVLATNFSEAVIDGDTLTIGRSVNRITSESQYNTPDKWTPKVTIKKNQ